MAHRGRPLLRDARRTRAWPVLATCVIVTATLGLLLREQAQPDGFDSVVDAAMVASFRGHQGVLPWLALPGSTIPLIAVPSCSSCYCPVMTAAGHRQPFGELTRKVLLAWLGYRRATWPDTASRHVLVSRISALGTRPVSP